MSTTQERTLEIDGMHCEHCVEAVRSALERMTEVAVQSVDIGAATVAYDPDAVSEDQIDAVLDDAGYELVG